MAEKEILSGVVLGINFELITLFYINYFYS